MCRIVARTLIFFILFANLAWAADMDEVGLANAADIVQLSVGSTDGAATGAACDKNGFCDHCCHGTAHYVGFPQQIAPAFAGNACCAPSFEVTAYQERDKEPPVPPPNI